jgi:hypothetical protein
MSGRDHASGAGDKVVRVRLTRHLEHRHGDLLRNLGTAGEPFGVGPRFHHSNRVFVPGPRFSLDVVKGVEDE